MLAVLLVAQLAIISASPPLPPAEAVAVLRRASPDLDISRGLYPLDSDVPRVIVITRPREEPKSWIPERLPPPSITFGLPHGWWRPIECRHECRFEIEEQLVNLTTVRRSAKPARTSSLPRYHVHI